MKKFLSVLFILLFASACFAATSVSQFGITWYFKGNYTTGQFANGDYYVVANTNYGTDPNVIIIRIDPNSVTGYDTNRPNRICNGSEINPIPGNPSPGNKQGYDSGGYDLNSRIAEHYVSTRNVARPAGNPLTTANFLTVEPNESLVSTISRLDFSCTSHRPNFGEPALYTSAVLTVLPTAPASGSFRPPFCGTDKTIKWNKSDLDYGKLADITPVSGMPTLHKDTLTWTHGCTKYAETIERMFERPWAPGLHISECVAEQFYFPLTNCANYGRDLHSNVGLAALALNTDLTDAQKETLLVRFVQLGIDCYGAMISNANTANNDQIWMEDGGHGMGRFFPIIFAGTVLGDEDLLAVADDTYVVNGYGTQYGEGYHFSELNRYFRVEETSTDVYNWGVGGYGSGDVDLPEYGIRHGRNLWKDGAPTDDSKTWNCCYRNSNGGSMASTALASYMMGIEGCWKHEPYFAYADRYQNDGTLDRFYEDVNDWMKNMWDTYRDDYTYGSDCATVSNPPSKATNPSPTNSATSVSITATLSWSNGGGATSYDVYFGTASPGASQGNQAGTTFNLGTLNYNTTYYWRIDAKNDDGTTTGDVWSFTTEREYVGWWKLDDGTGTDAIDASGNGNDGTLVNSPSWITYARDGNAINCTDANDAVEVGVTYLDKSKGTIALWVNPTSNTSPGDDRFIFGHVASGWGNRIQLYEYQDTNSLYLGLGDTHEKAVNIYNLPLNVWTHIALTWDGTNYVVYVNGDNKASGSYSGLTTLATYADIGNTGKSDERGEGFIGKIDDVRIYPRKLSQTDISTLLSTYDCYLGAYKSDWVELGKPDCWCGTHTAGMTTDPVATWPYQCQGDADNKTQVVGVNYRVYTNDYNILNSNWKRKASDPNLNPCADFDHKSQVFGQNYRVYTDDYNILLSNWQKKDSDLTTCED